MANSVSRRAAEKDLSVAELAKSFEPDVDGPKVLATSATAGKNSSAARPVALLPCCPVAAERLRHVRRAMARLQYVHQLADSGIAEDIVESFEDPVLSESAG